MSRGLGDVYKRQDSIDSLEIIAYVDDEFGVQMTGVGKEHFYSIETIAKYIEENA